MRRISNIDLAAARTFVHVAEAGQVTKAASALNITQSAASQQIRRLEQQLGIHLFQRSANRIRLSKDGEFFYQRAKQLIRLNDDIIKDIASLTSIPEVRLGVPHDLVEHVMPAVLKRIADDGTPVEIKLVSLSTGNLRSRLRTGEIDLSLTTEVAGSGEGEVLLEDQLIWAGAHEGRACFASPLVVALGDETDQFAGPAKLALDGSGLAWKAIRQEGGLGAVLAMLAADRAIAPFLRIALPTTLAVVGHDRLPRLPRCQVRLSSHGGSVTREQHTVMTAIRSHFGAIRDGGGAGGTG